MILPNSGGRPEPESLTERGGHALHTDKWKRCTKKVKGTSNPYAVCTASLGPAKTFKGKSRSGGT